MLLQSKVQNKFLIDLNDYKVIKKVNSGGNGIIFSVQNKKTNQICAAKVIQNKEDSHSKESINREISIMMQLNHPTIITFHGYSLKDIDGNDNITIIMNFANNGSLYDLLQSVKENRADENYDNTARQKILVGIARGMMYLHDHNIIHRDLKPGNIVFEQKYCPLITDFGLSKKYKKGDSAKQTHGVGSAAYMAPEVIDDSKYDMKADVYSFAIIMYEIITDEAPYPNCEKMTPFKLIWKVVNENYRPKFNAPIKKSFQELIEKCWSNDTDKRPSFRQLFDMLISVKDKNYDYCLDHVDVKALLDYVSKISDENQISKPNDSVTPVRKSNDSLESNKNYVIKVPFVKNKNLVGKKRNPSVKNTANLLKKNKIQSTNDMKNNPEKIKPTPSNKNDHPGINRNASNDDDKNKNQYNKRSPSVNNMRDFNKDKKQPESFDKKNPIYRRSPSVNNMRDLGKNKEQPDSFDRYNPNHKRSPSVNNMRDFNKNKEQPDSFDRYNPNHRRSPSVNNMRDFNKNKEQPGYFDRKSPYNQRSPSVSNMRDLGKNKEQPDSFDRNNPYHKRSPSVNNMRDFNKNKEQPDSFDWKPPYNQRSPSANNMREFNKNKEQPDSFDRKTPYNQRSPSVNNMRDLGKNKEQPERFDLQNPHQKRSPFDENNNFKSPSNQKESNEPYRNKYHSSSDDSDHKNHKHHDKNKKATNDHSPKKRSHSVANHQNPKIAEMKNQQDTIDIIIGGESGKEVQEKRNVDHFRGIDVHSSVKVHLHQGNEESVYVKADENIIRYVRTSVKDKILYVGLKKNHPNVDPFNFPSVRVTIRNLHEIHVHKTSKVFGHSCFNVNHCTLDTKGSSRLKIELNGNKANLQLQGSSEMRLKGNLIKFDAAISGSSILHAYDLEVDKADLIMRGSSIAHIKANEKLGYDVSGSSEIAYKSNPIIYRSNCSKSSSVKKKPY